MTRTKVIRILTLTVLPIAGTVLGANLESAAQPGKLNVLFIAIDDWRPEAGCYGSPLVRTPHIDRLAARGTTFLRAYCQQAVCSPSRTSLLTGRRPDTTKVYDLVTHFRRALPDVVTLPQCFKEQGYLAQGFSKIYHLEDPASWSLPDPTPAAPTYGKPATVADLARRKKERRESERAAAKAGQVWDWKKLGVKKNVLGPAWEDPDVPDNTLTDGKTVDAAIAALGQLKDQPFFLAVGLLKPHLPFVAPKKYYDLYRREDLKLAANPYPPKDCPAMAPVDLGELRNYHGTPNDLPIPDKMALDLIHGYLACTSYADAQVGRLLDALDRLGLAGNTVICLWGDHGFQLGEHGLWCKHNNFEIATRSPLILAVPGQPNAGAKTSALVEFVDVYPTLAELCGLAPPAGLEGTSLVPLLREPGRAWKAAAFSQYPRPGNLMGYTMRTDRYRYTEWLPRNGGDPAGRELYDHQLDPDENVNVVDRPENKELVAGLSAQLHAGWQAARPKP